MTSLPSGRTARVDVAVVGSLTSTAGKVVSICTLISGTTPEARRLAGLCAARNHSHRPLGTG